jgi:hypothetical protein
MVYSSGVSEIPNETTRIRIVIHNVIPTASLHTDFIHALTHALTQFMTDQGLMTPDVRLEMNIEPPTPKTMTSNR